MSPKENKKQAIKLAILYSIGAHLAFFGVYGLYLGAVALVRVVIGMPAMSESAALWTLGVLLATGQISSIIKIRHLEQGNPVNELMRRFGF